MDTIGTRITSLRKNENLSQEELGELLGVSRQAISKWEADAAIPEVDKLIALSRRFHVSVGWLLGVEDPTPEANDLSSDQLDAVEAIVSRYLDESAKRAPKPRRGLRITAAIVAAAFALFLLARVVSLQGQLTALNNSVGWMRSDLTEQISGISASVKGVLEEQNALVSSFAAEATALDVDASTITLSLSVALKSCTDRTRVTFFAKPAEGGEYSVPLTHPANGSAFVGELTLPLSDSIECTALILEDGATQLARLRSLYDYPPDSGGRAEAYFGGTTGPFGAGELHRDGSVTLYGFVTAYSDRILVYPAVLSYEIYRNGEQVYAHAYSPDAVPTADAVQSPTHTFDLHFTTPIEKGDVLAFVLRSVDNYGRETCTLLERYVIADNGYMESTADAGPDRADAAGYDPVSDTFPDGPKY